mgnify:CR=1 FL=1
MSEDASNARRFLCVHGHFYQPPRENPWLEQIEEQPSARPYHNWNERITRECYATNAASRILDGDGLIRDITNNYAKISFNFGPTLLSWLQDHAPEVYAAILAADRESQANFGGHGSAMAQVYNHAIMPLLNARDQRTQVLWGIRDFEHRFGRFPEGMWLAETAVNTDTLELLAEHGIAFTLLAPRQAGRVRPRAGNAEWNDVSDGSVDPKRPYLCRLPSGRSIALFFYDGPISQAVAFERLLERGERFAERLLGAFVDDGRPAQLVHIATDGETYGHHHRFGDMALAYALHYIEANELARLTNYGEYLELFPPTDEVEIVENSSWSCIHGVERWRSDCGCHSGMHPEWNQAWRAPLRNALDELRDTLAPLYARYAERLFRDPWAARDAYIEVILDRSDAQLDAFFERHAVRGLEESERVEALELLEQQRHAMLMYTSCGWFFDELSGIETVQVMAYAARSVQLAERLYADRFEDAFLKRLQRAASNVPGVGDGRAIYMTRIKPSMVNLTQVGAHFAINLAFEELGSDNRIYCYTALIEDYHRLEAGASRLFVGRASVRSEVTRERLPIAFGTLHLGDHNLQAGVQNHMTPAAYQAFFEDIEDAFARADVPETIRVLDRHFPAHRFTIRSLFHDEQKRAVVHTLRYTLSDVADSYQDLFDRHEPLLRFVADLDLEAPRELQLAAEYAVNRRLARSLADARLDVREIRTLLEQCEAYSVALDVETLRFAFLNTLEGTARKWAYAQQQDVLGDSSALESLERGVTLVEELPFELDLWRVQNIFFSSTRHILPQLSQQAAAGESAADALLQRLNALGHKLGVRMGAAKLHQNAKAASG